MKLQIKPKTKKLIYQLMQLLLLGMGVYIIVDLFKLFHNGIILLTNLLYSLQSQSPEMQFLLIGSLLYLTVVIINMFVNFFFKMFKALQIKLGGNK